MSMLVDELDGRAVVVKTAIGSSIDRLAREADRLRRASHPGVVEVLSAGPSTGGWELVTAHAGRSLAAGGAQTVEAVAHLGASLAATVADLHGLGVVHGRIDRSHVLVGDDGRAVLCGFGPNDGEGAPTPTDDVAAVGHLLTELLCSFAEADVFPERRWALRRPHADADRRALLVLADHACVEPPTARPTARRLAAALTEAAPRSGRSIIRVPQVRSLSPTRAGDGGPSDPVASLRLTDAEPTGRSNKRAVLLCALGAAFLLVAGLRSATPEDPDAADRRFPGAATPAGSSTDEAVGPGQETPVIEVDGRVATVDGLAYEIGQPGDQVVIGDWDCDGTPTPAVLRPRSGEVFRFDTWGGGLVVVVEPAARVDDAARLVVEPNDQCSELWVETAAGGLVSVDGERST